MQDEPPPSGSPSVSAGPRPGGRPVTRREALAIGGATALGLLVSSWGVLDAVRSVGQVPVKASPPRVSSLDDDEEVWPPPPIGLSTTEPTQFRFTADAGVAEAEAQLMHEAADFARDFYFKMFGVYLSNRPRIYLRASVARANEPLGDADGKSIRIYIGNVAWPRLNRTDKIEVMCHEIFHLFQSTLSRGAFPATFYLVEGTAEYAGQQAVIQGGLRTHDEFVARQVRIVRSGPQPPIDRVSRDSGGTNYAVSALAIDQLVGSGAMKSLADYFANLREQMSLAQAFERAFGESRAAFEARFEAWRVQNGIAAR